MNEAQEAYIKMSAMFEQNANPTEFTNEILTHNYVAGGLSLLAALIAGIITYICLIYLKDLSKQRLIVGISFIITLGLTLHGVTTIAETYFSPRLVIIKHLGELE